MRRFGDPPTLELLQALITTRRQELQRQAKRLGRRIFADRPACILARLEAYWNAWRKS